MPRDPNRIDSMLHVLETYWKLHPDLRLGQIIGNFSKGTDPYYIEDDVLADRIDDAIERGEIV